jgi:hypothetical protein
VGRDRGIEDLEKIAKAADREDKRLAQLFEGMIKTEAWKAFVGLLDKRLEDMGSVILTPAKSLDDLIPMENEKGAMRGLIIARDLPSATVAAMKASVGTDETEEEPSDA